MGVFKRFGLGEIGRQTIKGMVYTYLGVILGFVTTVLVFPHVLSKEQIGLVNLLLSVGLLFSTFGNLGVSTMIIRMFPYFRNDAQKNVHNGFGFILLLATIIGCLFAFGLYAILGDRLIIQNEGNALFTEYEFLTYPLIFFFLTFSFLDSYNIALGNAVTGAWINEVFKRLLILLAIGGFVFFNSIGFGQFVVLYVCSVGVASLLLFAYVMRGRRISFLLNRSFLKRKLRKVMANVAVFGFLESFGNIVVQRVDTIMIAYYLSLEEVGVYSTTFYFGALIIIPNRALSRISRSVISHHLRLKNMDQLKVIYQKSSINQFILGALLFLGIWVNIDNVFSILPESYSTGSYVIFFIGLANLLNLTSSESGSLIQLSRYYRWGAYLLILFSISVVLSNLIFIPEFGITGAAIASLTSVLLYQLAKLILVWVKMRIQPYSMKHLGVVAVALPVYFIVHSVPKFDHFMVDLVVRSVLATVLYVPAIVALRLSEDVNNIVNRLLRR